jgi:hypothetical protein
MAVFPRAGGKAKMRHLHKGLTYYPGVECFPRIIFFSSSSKLASVQYQSLPTDDMDSKQFYDHDVLGEKAEVTHEEGMHWGKLTEDELVIEKKLLRKIDFLIMPLVILVYLMNYIDR